MAKTIRDLYGIASSVPMYQTPKFIAGTELEIEAVMGGNWAAGWQKTTDGSLRNEGAEFISPPLETKALVDGFKQIHATFQKYNDFPKFSERTSIHVHVNCLDLTQQQVRAIVLWYALFEPVFFAMVEPNRANNIHCVPLDQTSLSKQYKQELPTIIDKWSKYTALNLLPLQSQGTIEFRHMEGHDDAARFEWWLKTLENLWAYGRDHTLTRQVLQDPKLVMAAFDAIFKDAPIREIRSNVLDLVSDSLIDVKLALV